MAHPTQVLMVLIVLNVVCAGLVPYGVDCPDNENDDADDDGDVPACHATDTVPDTADDDCHKKQKPAHVPLLATVDAVR